MAVHCFVCLLLWTALWKYGNWPTPAIRWVGAVLTPSNIGNNNLPLIQCCCYYCCSLCCNSFSLIWYPYYYYSEHPIQCIKSCTDGSLLAVSQGNTVTFWDPIRSDYVSIIMLFLQFCDVFVFLINVLISLYLSLLLFIYLSIYPSVCMKASLVLPIPNNIIYMDFITHNNAHR